MIKKKKTGFTLIEILVVIGIMGLFLVIGVPNYQEYTRRTQLVGSAKELRSAFWLAQSKSLAPLAGDITKYQILVSKDQNAFNIKGYKDGVLIPVEDVSNIQFGVNIFIDSILIDGVLTNDPVKIGFSAKAKEEGKMFFDPDGKKVKITLASKAIPDLKYEVELDKATGYVSLEKKL